MDTGLILGLAFTGAMLGLIEGIRPGPLLTMVIRETLTGGLGAGARAAVAPIFTDGPLIVISIFLAGWIADRPLVLCIISIFGAGFLAWMGIECFGIEPPSPDTAQAEVTGSFRRGVITNLLNPNVYVFWFLIGGPLMASAAAEEPFAPVAYAISFLGTIILVKVGIAYLFDRTRGSLSTSGYKAVLSLCGLGLLGFSIALAYQSYTLLGSISL